MSKLYENYYSLERKIHAIHWTIFSIHCGAVMISGPACFQLGAIIKLTQSKNHTSCVYTGLFKNMMIVTANVIIFDSPVLEFK
jgi:hypothetical protein